MPVRAKRASLAATFASALLLALLVPAGAGAAVFEVTKTNDTADGACDADCSLREAVIAANANAEADRIALPPGTYSLTLAGADEDLGATGDLDHTTSDLEIRGTGGGPAATVISAAGLGDRILDVLGGDVRLLNLTLRGGDPRGAVADNGGAIRSVRELTIRRVIFDANAADAGAAIHSSGDTARVTVEDSAFSDGEADYRGGAIWNEDDSTVVIARSVFTGNDAPNNRGGAIANQNDGAVTLTDSLLTGNTAGQDGGAIFHQNSTSFTLVRTAINGNQAAEAGGAIFAQNDSAMMIHESTIADNTALGVLANDGGGAIYMNNDSAVLIERSTISGNRSEGDAGALSRNNDGQLLMHNSTVSGNSAGGNGGAMIFDSAGGSGHIAIESSTIADNVADGLGGGIYNEGDPSLEAGLERTIVADNTAGGAANDCATDGVGDFDSNGRNLDTTGTCGFGAGDDLPNANAALGPLGDNGGPTETHALLAGSDAIDAAGGSCPPPIVDQRGLSRPQGAACDIGAFERVPPPPDITPPDTTPPELRLRAAKTQRVRKRVRVKMRVACDEPCDVKGRGQVKVKVGKGKRKSFGLRPASKSLDADEAKNLKLNPRGKKAARKAKRAIKRSGKGNAKIRVIATDDAGNRSVLKRTIKLKG